MAAKPARNLRGRSAALAAAVFASYERGYLGQSRLDAPAVALLARTLEAHLAGGGAVIYTTHQDVLIASTSLERIDIGEFAPC